MTSNNYDAKNDIRLHNLDRVEKDFDNFFTQVKQANEGDPSINNRNLKKTVRQAFDGMRDATLNILGSWGSNSEEDATGGGQQQSSPVPADGDGSLPVPSVESNTTDDGVADPKDVFTQLAAYASSCRSNSDVSTEPKENVIRSFETVTLDYPDDDDVSTIGPVSQRSDADPAVDTGAGRAEAAVVADAAVGSRVLAMLRRMGQRLLGFFQWLLNKIREAAVKVWNKVCDAFTGMFHFLRNLWNRVRGYSTVPCEELELQGSTEHHQQQQQQQLVSGQSATNLTHRSAMNRYGSTLRYHHHVEPSMQALAKFHAA